MGSLKGSPGVTTTSVGLAAGWPSGGHPVVVECDPAGGDLLARFRLEAGSGVVSLAAAARHRAGPGLVWQHTQRLPGGLPVAAGPVGAEQARTSLAQLTRRGSEVLRWAANRPGTVVIADCGRLDPDSPAWKVIEGADALLLLSGAYDDALAHVATRWPATASRVPRACFVLVGDGYPTDEVVRELDIAVTARLPHDPKGAALLGGRPGRRTTPSRTPLGRALAELADTVASFTLSAAQEQTTALRIQQTEHRTDPRPSWSEVSR
ncbi:hypothetical protein ABZX85_47270 [Streptomyces sp. NPDC004539]|uniref:MinD/ParA family ATP-binding protein n=1 Tax=Streptomyces sp. NPDC004539 TaxID=3154280 RepID=UPI0033A83F90